MRRPLCEKNDFNQDASFMMCSLRNSLVMALDDLFVSQMVSPNSRYVAEAALASRPIDSITLT